MSELWTEMGVIRYPLLVTALFVAGQSFRAWRAVRSETSASAALRVHAVLIWGVLSALFGILGTLIGILQVARAIEVAAAAPAGLVWGGIRVSLSSSVAGFLILSVAAMLWIALQFAERKRLTA